MNNVFSSAMVEMLDLGFTLQTKYPDYTSSLMKSVREFKGEPPDRLSLFHSGLNVYIYTLRVNGAQIWNNLPAMQI